MFVKNKFLYAKHFLFDIHAKNDCAEKVLVPLFRLSDETANKLKKMKTKINELEEIVFSYR